MKNILLLCTSVFLFANSPFDTPKEKNFDLSVFNTKEGEVNLKAMENKTLKCRYVCDKKIYKEQKIADAISFYKKGAK